MNVKETSLPGVLVLEPRIFHDDRGFFFETFNLAKMVQLGLPAEWRQDNFSFSRIHVIRGIHYQITQPQGKLVRVVTGAVRDVIVDLRKSSATFGQHTTVELSGESSRMVWIPQGFGHGFAALTDNVALSYKVTDYYSPKAERTVQWNDPALGIEWGVGAAEAVLSGKDAAGVCLADAEVFA